MYLLCANVVALLGYNLTDAPIMINQYDSYVNGCSLKTLIKYVCENTIDSYNCDQICKNMHSSHIQVFNFGAS